VVGFLICERQVPASTVHRHDIDRVSGARLRLLIASVKKICKALKLSQELAGFFHPIGNDRQRSSENSAFVF
jgi:hypothetical protein